MTTATKTWCSDCNSSFKDANCLLQHQKKTRLCQKYKNILFTCQICQYQTRGLKTIDNHLKICTEDIPIVETPVVETPVVETPVVETPVVETPVVETPVVETPVVETPVVEHLAQELEKEKTRVKVLWALLSSVTNIDLSTLISSKDNDLHIFNLSTDSTLYLHENTNNNIVSVTEDETDLVKIEKSSSNYRRVKKITVKPEPNKEEVTSVIDTVDKMKETFTHLDGNTVNGIKESCKEILKQLLTSRTYAKHLSKLKQLRSKLLCTLSIEEYKEVLEYHVIELTNIFTIKQQSERKIKTSVLKSLTPIDNRFLRYPGFTTTQLDAECRDTLKKVFKYGINFPKEFTPYSNISGLANYCVAVFPIEKLIKWCIINPYNFFNVIYIDLPKSSSDDPYSFYTLRSVNNGYRKWDMNCRLEDFSSDIESSLLPYMISMFRDLYYHLFNDNVYRADYSSTSGFAMEDCEQLAQNIILLSQPRRFCNKLRTLFMNNCTYSVTTKDSFNLTGDDSLQRKKYQEREKIEMVGTVRLLFDNITDEQSVQFYKSRNIA